MFSRVIWATRVDMQIAIVSTLFPIAFGIVVGILTGYYGGWLDAIFGRIVDLTVTFPFFVIVIAIVAVLGPGLLNMYIAIAVINWVFYARLIRAEIRVQKQADYAAAARVLGYSERRLVLRHLLPNAITPVLVYWVTDMALSILLGSSLGYLGLGAQPPTAEWGVLIADGRNFMNTGWWMSVFPGIAIVIAGVSFSLFGDGLADLLRKRR
jgi:peptide/nickel transport system permease protein